MSDHTPDHKEKTEQGGMGGQKQGDWEKQQGGQKQGSGMPGQREEGSGMGGERREERTNV
jgi:hypothetical protein